LKNAAQAHSALHRIITDALQFCNTRNLFLFSKQKLRGGSRKTDCSPAHETGGIRAVLPKKVFALRSKPFGFAPLRTAIYA